MDKNKERQLRNIQYEIAPVCDLCVHGHFSGGGKWGACGLHNYTHLKHTIAPRMMSIYTHGTCSDFEAAPHKLQKLREFEQFTEG